MNANDIAPLTERDIAEYLIQNPGFFQRNPELLTSLQLGSGEQITGADLTRVVDEARTVRRILRAYPTHYPPHIIEQAATSGAQAHSGRSSRSITLPGDRSRFIPMVIRPSISHWTQLPRRGQRTRASRSHIDSSTFRRCGRIRSRGWSNSGWWRRSS